MEWLWLGGLLLLPAYTLWQLWPPRMKRLVRNAWIGIRTATTTSSDAAWAAAHAAIWKPIVATSVLTVVVLIAGVIVVVNQDSGRGDTVANFVIAALVIWGGGLVLSTPLAQKAARSAD